MMANVGKIRNQGIELLLSGTPIKHAIYVLTLQEHFPITKIKSFLYQMDFIKKIIGMKELPVHQFKPILT